MKNIVLALFLFIPLTTYSLEYVYKELTLDIPDCEVTGGGIANVSPYDILLLSGKNWDMGFGDAGFMKDCLLISEKLGNTISCKEQDRIQMLDDVIIEDSQAARAFFIRQPNDIINRQEFKNYILYSSVGQNKYSIAILVAKKTGKTTEIKGKFGDKHLKWLRLEPL